MAVSDMKVRVGVTLDPNSKNQLKSQLEGSIPDIPVHVTADVSKAKNTIDSFISGYRNKNIKLTIDGNFSNVTSGLKTIERNAAKLKQQFSKGFSGVNISEGFNANQTFSEFNKIKSQLDKLGNYKFNWDFSFDNDQQIVAEITSVDGAVQRLYYTLQQVGDQRFYVLDNIDTTGIANADAKVEQLGKTLANLQGKFDALKGAQKLDLKIAAGESLEPDLNNATAALQKLQSTANVSKSDLNALAQSLATIKTNLNISEKSATKNAAEQYKQDSKAAQQLASDLRELNTLSRTFNEFMANNTKAANFGNLSSLQAQLKEVKSTYESTKTINHEQFSKLSTSIRDGMSSAKQFGATGSTAFEQVVSKAKELGTYLASSMMFATVIQGIRSISTEVREMDSAMTDLKKTTDGSKQDYANFLNGTQQTAQEIGTKTSDLVLSAAEWSRSGYNSLSDAQELSKWANVYTNVSEYNDVSEATKSLISTMKAYGKEVSDVSSIVDEFNAVGNTTATTSQGIGDALARAGSALSTSGNSLEQSIGLVVAGNNSLQDPEKVGNGLKTISLRLRSTKGELEALGLESDGAAESVTKLQTQLLNATNGRVNIFDANGDFKSTYEILTDLSKVWGDLDTVQQANITTWIAGATQANLFSSLMTNMGEGAEAMSTALNSSGSAMQENSRYMDSIEGKMSQLSSTFQTLSTDLLSSDLFKAAVTGANEFLQVIDKIVSATHGLAVPIAGAGAFGIFELVKNLGQLKHGCVPMI